MIEARATALAQLVNDGTLTQAQADAMLARMAQMQANGNCPYMNP
jgi:predicted Zn-dependent protease